MLFFHSAASPCRSPDSSYIKERGDSSRRRSRRKWSRVGGLHHHHRLANPAGLLRRTPVSTQTPCRAGRTVHEKVRNRRRSWRILRRTVDAFFIRDFNESDAWCLCACFTWSFASSINSLLITLFKRKRVSYLKMISLNSEMLLRVLRY